MAAPNAVANLIRMALDTAFLGSKSDTSGSKEEKTSPPPPPLPPSKGPLYVSDPPLTKSSKKSRRRQATATVVSTTTTTTTVTTTTTAMVDLGPPSPPLCAKAETDIKPMETEEEQKEAATVPAVVAGRKHVNLQELYGGLLRSRVAPTDPYGMNPATRRTCRHRGCRRKVQKPEPNATEWQSYCFVHGRIRFCISWMCFEEAQPGYRMCSACRAGCRIHERPQSYQQFSRPLDLIITSPCGVAEEFQTENNSEAAALRRGIKQIRNARQADEQRLKTAAIGKAYRAAIVAGKRAQSEQSNCKPEQP